MQSVKQRTTKTVRNLIDLHLIRILTNISKDGGVSNPSSADIRCFQRGKARTTATLAAGGTLGFIAMSSITHFGPVQMYMAKVPQGQDINNWDGSGQVWFKAGSLGATMSGGKLTWPHFGMRNPFVFPSLITRISNASAFRENFRDFYCA